MSEDRRTARRVRLPGVQVTYESAAGERQDARVVDLSRDGLFIPSAKPLAVGKRLSLEIQPIGDVTAWSALGRVVWVRDVDDGVERPAGMAVKIIDAEDAVLTAIEHLLEAREPTDRGLGFGDTVLPVRPRARSNPPSREKTMLGVGVGSTTATPILITEPGREPTLVGVGSGDASPNAREASLAIDLVTKKPPSVRPENAPVAPAQPEAFDAPERESPAPTEPRESTEPTEPTESTPPPRRRSSGRWIFMLLLLGAAGGAGYVFRARVLVTWYAVVAAVTKQLR
jgi:Tfp pilus assembly protein PilZ